MKKKSSFNLQQFRETYRIVEELQDEFVELVKEELLKTSSFRGDFILESTGATHGQVRRPCFITQIKISDIPVTLKFYLHYEAFYQGFCGYKLEKMLLSCHSLSILDHTINTENFKKFKIFYPLHGNSIRSDTVKI